MNTTVDRLHSDFSELLAFLDDQREISLRNVADDNLRKTLLMTVASSFERCLTEAVVGFVEEVTTENHVVVWLVRNKAVSRQYHTWFDWDSRNANKFFSLFGAAFRKYAKTTVDKDNELQSSIRAFLEVGRERNRLVHQDFGNFTLEKTSEEIYELYSCATRFVEWFLSTIREFSDDMDPDNGQPV